MKRIESSEVIHADIQKVWNAMVAIDKYPDWNPFVTKVKSASDSPIVGTEMEFTVLWKDGSTTKTSEIVDGYSPPQKLNHEQSAEWSYFFKSFMSTIGFVKATRKQMLTSSKEGVTLYYTVEEFRGWGVSFLPEDNIKDGFERQAKALKKYCELDEKSTD